MLVTASAASDLVDRFEDLLANAAISGRQHPSTGADMLPFHSILKKIKDGFFGTPDDPRKDYTAAVAVHDLAAKILGVR